MGRVAQADSAFPVKEDAPSDAPPPAPEAPVDGECCQRGCEFCVWVVYHEAQRKYEQAYAQWLARRSALRGDSVDR